MNHRHEKSADRERLSAGVEDSLRPCCCGKSPRMSAEDDIRGFSKITPVC